VEWLKEFTSFITANIGFAQTWFKIFVNERPAKEGKSTKKKHLVYSKQNSTKLI
jgi:hypothetical protein